MPVWAFAFIILVALLACPLSMWVMGKVMRRKISCSVCITDTRGKQENVLEELGDRKAAVEREIAQVKTEIEQDGSMAGAAVRTRKG